MKLHGWIYLVIAIAAYLAVAIPNYLSALHAPPDSMSAQQAANAALVLAVPYALAAALGSFLMIWLLQKIL